MGSSKRSLRKDKHRPKNGLADIHLAAAKKSELVNTMFPAGVISPPGGGPAGPAPRGPREAMFVVETEPGFSADSLRKTLEDYYAHSANSSSLRFEVEPVFEGADPKEQIFKLANFFLIKLPGVARAHMRGGMHDYAYELKQVPGIVDAKPESITPRFVPYSSSGTSSNTDLAQAPADVGWAQRATRIPEALLETPPTGGALNGSGIVIGHPDTGWRQHPQLDKQALDLSKQSNTIDPLSPFDATDPIYPWVDPFDGHGTATASIMVSSGHTLPIYGDKCKPGTPNPSSTSDGLPGIATGAKLIPIRCIDSVVLVSDVEVARAVWWATRQGAHVISLSLGGLPGNSLAIAIAHAVYMANIIVCAAAGQIPNGVAKGVRSIAFPAGYPFCIAVAGTTCDDTPWEDSLSGLGVTICAPAKHVYCAKFDSQGQPIVAAGEGTSYSTTHVAGTAALWLAFWKRDDLIQRYSWKKPLQDVFKELLHSSARTPIAPDGRGWDIVNYGSGILDAATLLKSPLPDPGTTILDLSNWQPPSLTDVVLQVFEGFDPATLRERIAALFGVVSSEFDKIVEAYGTEVLEFFIADGDAYIALTADVSVAASDVVTEVKSIAAKSGDFLSNTIRTLMGI